MVPKQTCGDATTTIYDKILIILQKILFNTEYHPVNVSRNKGCKF